MRIRVSIALFACVFPISLGLADVTGGNEPCNTGYEQGLLYSVDELQPHNPLAPPGGQSIQQAIEADAAKSFPVSAELLHIDANPAVGCFPGQKGDVGIFYDPGSKQAIFDSYVQKFNNPKNEGNKRLFTSRNLSLNTVSLFSVTGMGDVVTLKFDSKFDPEAGVDAVLEIKEPGASGTLTWLSKHVFGQIQVVESDGSSHPIPTDPNDPGMARFPIHLQKVGDAWILKDASGNRFNHLTLSTSCTGVQSVTLDYNSSLSNKFPP